MIIDTLCFSSGGLEGFSYIGAINELLKYNFIDMNNIKYLIGTSAGSIMAFILNIGYTPDEIVNYLKKQKCTNIDIDYDIELFFSDYGFSDGKTLLDIIVSFLYNRYKIKDINFIDLFNLTKKKLSIVSTNFNKNCEVIFSYETHPTMSVLTALYTSICIPLIFKPIKIDNDYYVDGALKNCFPLNHCNPETTIGLKIGIGELKLNSIQDLIFGSLSIISDSALYDESKYNIIEIIKDDINFANICINFNTIEKLIKKGEQQSLRFLKLYYKKEIKKQKDKIILDILNNIIDKIN